MPAAVITRDDAERIRRNLERRGAPVPEALKNTTTPIGKARGSSPSPGRQKAPASSAGAGRRGAGGPAPAGAADTRSRPAPPAGVNPTSEPRPASPARAGARGPRGRSGGAGRGGRSTAGGARTLRQRAGQLVRLSGGDGGGLLLAFWLYPLALATLQLGAKGPGIWLRAKFLNQDMTGQSPTGNGTAVGPASPSSPAAPNPQPTYGGGGSTPARIL